MGRKNSGWKTGLMGTLVLSLAVCRAQTGPGVTAESAHADERIENSRLKLSSNALQIAQILGIEPLAAKLSVLSAAKTADGGSGTSLEEIAIRQQIAGAIVVGILDVDSTVDEINSELAQVIELRSSLLAQRQRAVGITNLATLALSTGLGAVGGLLQLSDGTRTVGDGIGVAAGGFSSLLSFHSFRQQHAGSRPSWVLPHMLAPFFAKPDEQNSSYPASVWAYLECEPLAGTSHASRREQLLAEWRTAKRFAPVESSAYSSKIGLLTETNAANRKLNLDLLSDRTAMLADVRDEVTRMKRDLSDLLRGILLWN